MDWFGRWGLVQFGIKTFVLGGVEWCGSYGNVRSGGVVRGVFGYGQAVAAGISVWLGAAVSAGTGQVVSGRLRIVWFGSCGVERSG